MAFKGSKSRGSKFEYKPRSDDDVRARATSRGSREGFLVDGVKTFSPKQGGHTVRILPPTWDGAKHYGMDLYVHYNVGTDGNTYLCLAKMQNKHCALCEERARAIKEDDEEMAESLKPRQRVGCWVIDRDNERDGPLFWSMPWTLDREIVQQSIDKKSGEVYALDSHTKGYDVSFERQGDGQTTKYVGVQLERRPSALSPDDDAAEAWLEFVQEHPLPDQLVFQDEEKLEEVVAAGLGTPRAARNKMKEEKRSSRDKDKEDERPAKPTNGKGKDREDEEEERPAKRSKKQPDFDLDDLTWDEVHDLDEAGLNALAEQADIDIEDAGDEEEAADIICKELKIRAPKKARDDDDEEEEKKESGKPSLRNRIGSMRDKDRERKGRD